MTCNTTLGGLRLKDEAAMDLGGMTPEVRPGRRAGVRLSTQLPRLLGRDAASQLHEVRAGYAS